MRIVVNADDFGFSAETVAATVECFERGLLTSATIMPRMPATEEALAYARERRDVSFGVHLTFTGDGSELPVSAPASIPTLVDADGRFPRANRVRLRALLRLASVAEIEREVAAQVQAVQAAGVPVTHVDSHRHLHKHGPFRAALARALPRLGIARVRNVQDVYLARPLASPTYWIGRAWRRRLMAEFATTEHFYMPTSAHDRDWHRIVDVISGLPGATIEIGLHPGRIDEWRRREQASLDQFVEAARAGGHELVDWRAIAGA